MPNAPAPIQQRRKIETEDSGVSCLQNATINIPKPAMPKKPLLSMLKADETIITKSNNFYDSFISDMDASDFNSDNVLNVMHSTPVKKSSIKHENENIKKQGHYRPATPRRLPPPIVEPEYTDDEEEQQRKNQFFDLNFNQRKNEAMILREAAEKDDDKANISIDSCPSTYNAFLPRRR
uniref:Uncharacterized protein n=1 Tax=Panagrolaimus superbus TaxID=310955 RepID=A0A914YQQ3_9BILA